MIALRRYGILVFAYLGLIAYYVFTIPFSEMEETVCDSLGNDLFYLCILPLAMLIVSIVAIILIMVTKELPKRFCWLTLIYPSFVLILLPIWYIESMGDYKVTPLFLLAGWLIMQGGKFLITGSISAFIVYYRYILDWQLKNQ